MESRSDIINKFIRSKGYKKYLEIGIEYGRNFQQIECETKLGIDIENKNYQPAKNEKICIIDSKEYLENTNDGPFDIILIDGDHSYEGAKYDVKLSLDLIKSDGTIICHDCLPQTKKQQENKPQRGSWNGKVWKSFLHNQNNIIDKGFTFFTVDTDWGLGIITKTDEIHPEIVQAEIKGDEWEFFQNNRNKIMNVITLDEFYKLNL